MSSGVSIVNVGIYRNRFNWDRSMIGRQDPSFAICAELIDSIGVFGNVITSKLYAPWKTIMSVTCLEE